MLLGIGRTIDWIIIERCTQKEVIYEDGIRKKKLIQVKELMCIIYEEGEG